MRKVTSAKQILDLKDTSYMYTLEAKKNEKHIIITPPYHMYESGMSNPLLSYTPTLENVWKSSKMPLKWDVL